MTIVEILLVMGLFSTVMLLTHKLVSTAVNYYHQSTQSLDIQREALVGISRLTSNLDTSHRGRMFAGSTPTGYIVYPSIFDRNRDFETDIDGRVRWQGIGCYFQGTNPKGVGVIYNPTEDLPTGPSDVPPDPLSFTPPYDLSFFSGYQGRVTCRNVETFTPTLTTDGIDITLVISISMRGKSTMTLQSKSLPRN